MGAWDTGIAFITSVKIFNDGSIKIDDIPPDKHFMRTMYLGLRQMGIMILLFNIQMIKHLIT